MAAFGARRNKHARGITVNISRDYHILVLEDEPATQAMLASLMEGEGFRVTTAASGAQAQEAVAQTRFDLVLLDLNLPDDDGLYIARELRAKSDVGIIMLTSRKEDIDRVIGLEMGADDYVTKPFFPRELVARVKNLLRRLNQPRATRRADGAGGSELRRFNGWEMDMAKRTLLNAEGLDVSLTRAEFDLLTALVNSAGRVLSREQLLDAIGSQFWTPVDRTIDVLVSRLRRKMEADPKSPTMIQTSHGYGYKFAPAVTVG
ncbi:TorCAD operon transcriptional regulatory protein TorR [mine drainage metagenome]|uniref:TorCAD operon transcriptional regulatory protein TorR n=1 Tax=mine drainage metagenome TaxID=410659 RepID=A0A1J5RQ18_9ZZZZ